MVYFSTQYRYTDAGLVLSPQPGSDLSQSDGRFGIPAVEAMASGVPVSSPIAVQYYRRLPVQRAFTQNCLQPEELARTIVNIQNNPAMEIKDFRFRRKRRTKNLITLHWSMSINFILTRNSLSRNLKCPGKSKWISQQILLSKKDLKNGIQLMLVIAWSYPHRVLSKNSPDNSKGKHYDFKWISPECSRSSVKQIMPACWPQEYSWGSVRVCRRTSRRRCKNTTHWRVVRDDGSLIDKFRVLNYISLNYWKRGLSKLFTEEYVKKRLCSRIIILIVPDRF